MLVLRGSTTFKDWRCDSGSNRFWTNIGKSGGRKLFGAGRASVLCGLAVVAGIIPVGRVVFGEPRPGFQPLAHLIAAIKESRSYRNGKFGTFEHGYVTKAPYRIGLLQYVHPSVLIDVYALERRVGNFLLSSNAALCSGDPRGAIRPPAS